MKILRYPILTILLIFIVHSASAQLKDAKKEMSLYNYSKAIEILQKYAEKKKGKISNEAMLLLAESYRKQNQPLDAKNWYAKALSTNPEKPVEYFNYAQCLRSCGEYPAARQFFLRYDSLVPGDKRGKLYAGFCDSAMTWQSAKAVCEIKNAGAINSRESDFGPVRYNAGILFASDRMEKKSDNRYGWTGNDYLHIYFSKSKSAQGFYNEFDPAIPGPESLNGKYHDGPVTFSANLREAFITRTLLYPDKGKKDPDHIRTHLLKIYMLVNTGGKWTTPESFFLNSDDHSVGHPALSASGDTLVYVSDQEGGSGGTNLYVIYRKNGKWSEPASLGTVVNTSGNEMFPYLAANGDLYFASDGLPGFGGLDIFVSRNQAKSWSSPVNMGQPLNSASDDFSILIDPKEKTGLLSSNRPGGQGSDDIYSFRMLPELPKPPQQVFIAGCVKDRTTFEPIPLATVFMLDRATEKILVIKTDGKGCFRTPLASLPRLIFKAAKESYLPDCLSMPPLAMESPGPVAEFSLPRDLLLDKLELNKEFVLKNIYYDFDKWNIRKDAEPSLDSIVTMMKEHPVTVELGSHTDCRGSVEYNEILSQHRAESAVKYITGQGIDPSRIKAKGYGKSQLVNRCNCEKNEDCSDAGHQANRRTVFKITGWVTTPAKEGFVPEKFREGEIIGEQDLPEGFFGNCK